MPQSISVLELLYSARWYIVLIIVASYAVQSYLSYRRLSQVNGPWLAQWSVLWLLGAVYRQRTHLELHEVSKTYGMSMIECKIPETILTITAIVGPLARIGPNTLITADVEQFHRMSAPRSPYTRSDWYIGFRLAPGVDNVFSMRDEKLHTKRRAQMNMGVRRQTTQIQHLEVHCLDSIREKKISTWNPKSIPTSRTSSSS
jgi:hypothetical protein